MSEDPHDDLFSHSGRHPVPRAGEVRVDWVIFWVMVAVMAIIAGVNS